MERIQDRFNIGRETYGHGVRVLDDTRTWGTVKNSWLMMAEEEILDALIYVAADILRKTYENEQKTTYEFDETDDNSKIIEILHTNGVYPIVDKLWEIHYMLSG